MNTETNLKVDSYLAKLLVNYLDGVCQNMPCFISVFYASGHIYGMYNSFNYQIYVITKLLNSSILQCRVTAYLDNVDLSFNILDTYFTPYD